ncbi:adenosine receptor A1-like, partial [Stylophora pistillata]|uniref:adenosine receptor A1-like n=1 Tax=Stylophora pistillata TaxID=50429 RepID=UPI000C04C71C
MTTNRVKERKVTAYKVEATNFMHAICVCSAIMAGILSLLAMIANGVLLYVMYKDPLRCFRKPISVLIAALAANDLLTGSVISGLHIRNEISCKIREDEATIGTSFESIISLFAINNGTFLIMSLSVERLIAVALPFYYRATASGRKTLACAVCVVAYSVGFCLLQFTGIPQGIYDMLQVHLNLTFPLVAVLIFNFVLLKVLRGYRRSRRRACCMNSDASDNTVSANEKRFDIDKQFAFTAILIVLFLFISHLPFYAITLLEVHCSYCAGMWLVSCRRISLPFLFINAACNPFTYTFRIRECRRSLKLLFFKWQETIEVSPRAPVTPDSTRSPIALRKMSQ